LQYLPLVAFPTTFPQPPSLHLPPQQQLGSLRYSASLAGLASSYDSSNSLAATLGQPDSFPLVMQQMPALLSPTTLQQLLQPGLAAAGGLQLGGGMPAGFAVAPALPPLGRSVPPLNSADVAAEAAAAPPAAAGHPQQQQQQLAPPAADGGLDLLCHMAEMMGVDSAQLPAGPPEPALDILWAPPGQAPPPPQQQQPQQPQPQQPQLQSPQQQQPLPRQRPRKPNKGSVQALGPKKAEFKAPAKGKKIPKKKAAPSQRPLTTKFM
jgi:hypothetical protein